MNNFAYSKRGLLLTEISESLRLKAYQDSAGVWTIGYGHTGPDVRPGRVITQADAGQLLDQDVATVAAAVNRLVTVPIDQNQFDALVDFAFNLGIHALEHSTLLFDLNCGDPDRAALQFARWVYAGGQRLEGLVKRRAAEAALFQEIA